MTLIKIAEIRNLAEKLGITEIKERGNSIRVSFGPANNINTFALVMIKQSYGERLMITSSPDLGLTLYTGVCPDKAGVVLDFVQALESNALKGSEESLKS